MLCCAINLIIVVVPNSVQFSEMFKIFWFSSGIGHMVGAGIFVLTGTVVKDEAGPAAVLSYFFAGVGALLSSLCYAEFGAKVPKVRKRSFCHYV